MHVLFYTGRRVSEVTKLKVRDFFEDGGYWVLDFIVKGGKRNRLAIHHELQLALRAYLEASGHGAEREAPLFLAVQRSELRKPLTSRQVSKLFHNYAQQAELPIGVTPHSAQAPSSRKRWIESVRLKRCRHPSGTATSPPRRCMTNTNCTTARVRVLPCGIKQSQINSGRLRSILEASNDPWVYVLRTYTQGY